jgi:hypothetical protein
MARQLMLAHHNLNVKTSEFRVCGVRLGGDVYPIYDDDKEAKQRAKTKTLSIMGRVTRLDTNKKILVSFDVSPFGRPCGCLVTWELKGERFKNPRKVKISGLPTP